MCMLRFGEVTSEGCSSLLASIESQADGDVCRSAAYSYLRCCLLLDSLYKCLKAGMKDRVLRAMTILRDGKVM